ncbi:hypothetical protein [Pseudomonas mosselii]|uniref:Uncharacterized protein n=1 Tax=Pseudomonas mosselii TaxID=78327 RepID=A0A7W2Q0W6_9PSED|nr:hypothetical protein [Pseudomonas mosselii]MBA6068077.1 hypothetical protein [Pseudomonas mosselii]
MQLHEAGEVVQVVGHGNANQRIKDGWVLLAVTSVSDGSEMNRQVVAYVLGKPRDDGGDFFTRA